MRIATLLILFVSVGAMARDEPKDETATDRAALKGKWEVVSAEYEGNSFTAVYWGTVFVIEGDKLYLKSLLSRPPAAAFKLDTKARPRAIEIGGEKGGIYELNGDSLKLCLNEDGKRPKEFKTAAGDNTSLFVLKRRKP